jgi:protein ImuB
VVIIEHQAKGARVVLRCARAARAGVRAGMPLAEALAIQSQLAVWEQDSAGDRQALERLAEWAQRYSPIVGLEEQGQPEKGALQQGRPGKAVPQASQVAPASLLLDISGCAACFHGEDRLAQQAARELRKEGWDARVAVASTLGAAWAVAHTMDAKAPFCLVPPDGTEQALAPLPTSALRLPDEAVAALAALGIERIAELAALPRASVPGRFGACVLQRLDQAMGRLPELIVPHTPLPGIQVGCSFAYPTDRAHVLHYALDNLLERIEAILRSRNRGAKKLECRLFHEEENPEGPAADRLKLGLQPVLLEVNLFRPSGSARHLGKLLKSRLERVRIEAPVTRLSLRVPAVEMMVQRQLELFDSGGTVWGGHPTTEELSDLIDRLSSQFGQEAVTFVRLVEDCQPEYACRFEPAISKHSSRVNSSFSVLRSPFIIRSNKKNDEPRTENREARTEGAGVVNGRRPVLVWPVPMPIQVLAVLPAGAPLRFSWLGKEYTVSQAWGPERIETGWWRGQDVHRDYYTVATEAGTRLWLFRRHEDQHWFVHGCFD